jgi:sugar porter (SP) family MFS transporter
VAITVGALIFLLGGALQTGATNKEFMMAGRFFAGVSIGQLALLVPLYQSEIAHPSIRGRLTTLQQFFLGIGALIAAWINYAMIHNYHGSVLQWRFPLGFQMAPAVPLLFVTLILPESPRWLMLKGREEEALQTLANLHARGDTSDPFVLGEFHEMRNKIREESQIDQGWGQIFSNRQNLRKVMLGVILQFSVQMTGVSFLQYYAPRIFAKVGFSTETTLLLGAASGFPNLVAQFSVVMLVDKVGRRKPLIFCNIGSGFMYIFILWITYKFTVEDSGNQTMGRAFVAVTCEFQANHHSRC